MNAIDHLITDDLASLNAMFRDFGYDLVFVGGCVRDTMAGLTPKDIDLATNATPAEQVAMYKARSIRYIETGLQHGTVTVVLNGEPYEITTYRIDADTDGRHATVEYTRSLEQDLMRRDLTINAMAMTFDGELIDPYGGSDDLESGCIRFVGNASERITEDYLRIMRFFRFYGRFGSTVDSEAIKAIEANMGGLSKISVERIWSEMAKIILDEKATYAAIMVFGVLGLAPKRSIADLVAARQASDHPVDIMTVWFGDEIEQIAERWKWSNMEKERARFVLKNQNYRIGDAKLDLVNGVPRDWVASVLKLSGQDSVVEEVMMWAVPKMPVSGSDLIAIGICEGPQMGQVLKDLKKTWASSDYTLDKNKLMATLQIDAR